MALRQSAEHPWMGTLGFSAAASPPFCSGCRKPRWDGAGAALKFRLSSEDLARVRFGEAG